MNTQRTRLWRACCLLAGLAALAVPVQALAKAEVPFKGSDAGGFGPGNHGCNSGDPLDIDGVGTATHVGKYTYHADECFNGTTLTFTGTFTITAANGDTITGTYVGVVPPFVFPNATYEQDMQITGGTGRFAGASGELHGSGQADLGSGEYSQVLSGTSSSPGSAKK